MKKQMFSNWMLSFAFLTFIFINSSCSDDDESTAFALNFEGNYGLTSAIQQDDDQTNNTAFLAGALLMDTPCDAAISGNTTLIRLENGANEFGGDVLLVCSNEDVAAQDQGNWQFVETNASPFILTIFVVARDPSTGAEIDVDGDGSTPDRVPFTLDLGDDPQFTTNANNEVTVIEGVIDFGDVPGLNFTTLTEVTFTRQ